MLNVRAVLFFQPPFVTNCGFLRLIKGYAPKRCKNQFFGVNVDTFLFMSKLLKLNYTIHIARDMGAPNADGQWSNTSMFGMLANGLADISVNTPFQSYQRQNITQTMHPIGFSHLSLMIRRPPLTIRTNTLFLPFSGQVWLFVLFMTVFVMTASIGWILLEHYFSREKEEKKDSNKLMERILMAYEQSLYPLVSKGDPPPKEGYRFLLLSWQYVVIVVLGLYNAFLFDFLNTPFRLSAPFETAAELGHAINTGTYQVVIPYGIFQFLSVVMNLNQTKGMKDFSQAFLANPPRMIRDADRFRMGDLILDGQVFIDIDFVVESMTSGRCELLELSIKETMGSHLSTVFSLEFPHVQEFDKWGQLIASYYNTRIKEFNRTTTAMKPDCQKTGPTEDFRLKLPHLWIAFVVALIGGCISLIALAVERVYARKHDRKVWNIMYPPELDSEFDEEDEIQQKNDESDTQT